MSPEKTALAYAQRGWHVFPLAPKSKVPYEGFAWRDLSTNDPDKIAAAAAHPGYAGCNWALDCGKSDLLVVDLDVKPHQGIDGTKDYAALGLDPTAASLVVKTPRGGTHLYFQGSDKSTVGQISKGIDTRGEGGYVVIPDSAIQEGSYVKVTDAGPLTPAPTVIHAELNRVAQDMGKRADRADAVCELDQESNVAQAVNYLVAQAPEAEEGARDHTCYKVACRVRDFAISEATAEELMLEHYMDKVQTSHDFGVREVQRTVRSAYRYSKDRAGNATAAAMFPPASRSTEAIRCASDIDVGALEPRQWIMRPRYIRRNVTVTVAPGAAGKSSLVLVEGLSIATGKQLTYHPVNEKGAVWYYNTEDPNEEMEYRIIAAAKHHKLTKDDLRDFFFSSGRTNPITMVKEVKGELYINEEGIKWLIEGVKARKAVLLIVDPFVRAHEVSENDNMQIDKVVQQFQRISDETGCAVSLVHHTSKGAKESGNMDKARGASALVNAARITHTFYTMSPKEAEEHNVQPERCKWYARLDNAKENLTPPTSIPEWYEKKSVRIFWNSDETIGTVEPARGLDRVTVEDTHKMVVDCAISMFEMNQKRAFSSLALELERMGLFDVKAKQIQRYLEQSMGGGLSRFGDIYFVPCRAKGDSGRMVTGIQRVDPEQVPEIKAILEEKKTGG